MSNSSRRASPYQAIRAKCLDCAGGSYNEVKLCIVTDCPSWAWRFGCHAQTAHRKHPHLLDAPLVRRVVPQAAAIVGSDSAADIIKYLEHQHQEANKPPPSTLLTTSAPTQEEARSVL